jgi:lysozyme family protein
MTFEALAVFKALQAQINRIAHIAGFSKIRVDGDLGPQTVVAANKGIKFIGGTTLASDCNMLAKGAEKTRDAFKRNADERGVAVAVKGPTAPKRGPSPAPGVPGPVIEAGFTQMLTSPLGLAALAIAGLLIWRASKKPKRKKAKRKRKKATYKKKMVTTWL